MADRLPVELVLSILEFALQDDPHTGAQCARVCKSFAHVMSGMLYDTVSLRHWRSTRAFERILNEDDTSPVLHHSDQLTKKQLERWHTLDHLRSELSLPQTIDWLSQLHNLSAPFMLLQATPAEMAGGRGQEHILQTIASRCPNLKSLQLLHLPVPSAETLACVTRCHALEELFVLLPYCGPLPAVRRLFFHGAAVVHQPHPHQASFESCGHKGPTHVSITHSLTDRASGTLASVRTVLSFASLEVLVIRFMQATPLADSADAALDIRDTAIWRGLEAFKDPRVRAGLETTYKSATAHSCEPTQTEMVHLWEDHVRSKGDNSIWEFGVPVWTMTEPDLSIE